MPLAFKLLLLSYTLFAAAWTMGNPPGAAPDEASQYIKALGVSAGVLTGEPVHFTTPPISPVDVFDRKLRRSVPVPRHLDPARFADPVWNFACNAGRPEVSAGCIHTLEAEFRPMDRKITNFGAYPPFVYGPAGVAMRVAPNGLVALYIGRAVTALAFLAFTAATMWQLGSDTPLRTMIGVLVAVTPMALFSGSSLSSSGYEIGAGLAFSASAVRLFGAAPPSRFSWAIFACSGVVLAAARPVGPMWIAIIGVVSAVALGLKRCWARMRAGGAVALLSSAAILAAVLASVAWQALVQPSISGDMKARLRSLGPVFDDQGFVYRQQIGNFGWLDSALPSVMYHTWTFLLGMLVVLAVATARWRQRIALALSLAAVFGAMMLLGVLAFEIYHFPASLGRWVLPLSVLIPVLAAQNIRGGKRVKRLAPPLVAGTAALVAAVQWFAWYANAHRHAVGRRGPWFFASVSDWSPPLGWWSWMFVTGFGAVAMVAAGVVATRTAMAEVDAGWAPAETCPVVASQPAL